MPAPGYDTCSVLGEGVRRRCRSRAGGRCGRREPSSARTASVSAPSAGAGPPSVAGVSSNSDRVTRLTDAAGDRVHVVDEQPDRPRVGVVGELGRRADDAARHPLGLQAGHAPRRWSCPRPPRSSGSMIGRGSRRCSVAARRWATPAGRRTRRRRTPGTSRRSRRRRWAWPRPSRRGTGTAAHRPRSSPGCEPSPSSSTSLPAASTHRNDTTASSIDSSTCWPPWPRSRASSAAVIAWRRAAAR